MCIEAFFNAYKLRSIMKKILFLFLCMFYTSILFAQTIEWSKGFGGTDDDELVEIHQTNDGGYILGDSSNINRLSFRIL